MRTRPLGWTPAIVVGCRRSVTLVVPPAMADLSVVPLACVIAMVGMWIEVSVPPGENVPAALFTSTTPIAPASWAFLTLIAKPTRRDR